MRLVLAFLCLLLGWAYHLMTGWYPEVSWFRGPALSIVWPVLVVAFGLGAISFHWIRRNGDPVQFAWRIFAFVGCCLILPLTIAREQQASIDQDRERAITKVRKELRLRQLRLAREQQEQLADRKERAKTDRFVQYEGRIADDLLDSLRELDARMLDEVKEQSSAYRQAMDANPTLGPEAWMRFRTLDQLEIELAAHKALYEQARAFQYFVESFEVTYTTAISDLQLQPPADRIAVAEMERILQDWDQSGLLQIRRLDVRMIGTAVKALAILSEEWGRWSFDPRQKQISFENFNAESAFTEAIVLLKAISEEVRLISSPDEPI